MPQPADERLSQEEVAAHLRIAASTWRAYVARGQAPAADGRFNARTPFWHRSTIVAWDASRPGRGNDRG